MQPPEGFGYIINVQRFFLDDRRVLPVFRKIVHDNAAALLGLA